MIGGNKVHKPQKSKFKKNQEEKESFKDIRKKHKDKAVYRLQRQEANDSERY